MGRRLLCSTTVIFCFFVSAQALTPLLDYIIPIWPSVSCSTPAFDPPLCGTTTGACQSPTPSAQLALYFAQVQARVAACPNFFYFTAQCKNSLILHGAPECYFVFDQVSQRTGLNAIKNVAPYPGLELVTCVLQLDCGPPKTSPICFDNSGHDKYHPYVVARVEGGIPEYNLIQPRFGWIIKDNNVGGVQYTFSFQGPSTSPVGCAFI